MAANGFQVLSSMFEAALEHPNVHWNNGWQADPDQKAQQHWFHIFQLQAYLPNSILGHC